MVYEVNDEKKKQVVAEIKKKRSDKVKIPYIVFKIGLVICFFVFLIPTVISIYYAVAAFKEGYGADGFFMLLFIVLGFMAALVLMIIPACIRSVAIRKYLMAWVPKNEEQVILTEKAIEQGFCNKLWGEFFYTFKVRYRDIVRMEYDENQCLLRVYGPREERHWMDSDKGHCVNKFPVDYENESEGWIEIPTYFENFEGLKKELEEKSGKVIENKSRPFLKYK